MDIPAIKYDSSKEHDVSVSKHSGGGGAVLLLCDSDVGSPVSGHSFFKVVNT